jgi:hypothetical protein
MYAIYAVMCMTRQAETRTMELIREQALPIFRQIGFARFAVQERKTFPRKVKQEG